MDTISTTEPTMHDRSFEAPTSWRLGPGAHVALATTGRARPAPIAVRSGAFEADHSSGIGTLTIELAAAAGSFHGVAMLERAGVTGSDVWHVSGTLVLLSRAIPVCLTLHDHGVVQRSGTWWWLSGTGVTPRSRRAARHQVSLVADLVFVPE